MPARAAVPAAIPRADGWEAGPAAGGPRAQVLARRSTPGPLIDPTTRSIAARIFAALPDKINHSVRMGEVLAVAGLAVDSMSAHRFTSARKFLCHHRLARIENASGPAPAFTVARLVVRARAPRLARPPARRRAHTAEHPRGSAAPRGWGWTPR